MIIVKEDHASVKDNTSLFVKLKTDSGIYSLRFHVVNGNHRSEWQEVKETLSLETGRSIPGWEE